MEFGLMSTKYENCTIYYQGSFGFGYNKLECKWVEIEIGKYAQYGAAVHVKLLQKGKRKPVGFVQTYKPSLVVVLGHGQPDVEDKMVKIDEISSRSKYSSCDPRWESDFLAWAKDNLQVVENYHGWNSYSGGFPQSAEAC